MSAKTFKSQKSDFAIIALKVKLNTECGQLSNVVHISRQRNAIRCQQRKAGIHSDSLIKQECNYFKSTMSTNIIAPVLQMDISNWSINSLGHYKEIPKPSIRI